MSAAPIRKETRALVRSAMKGGTLLLLLAMPLLALPAMPNSAAPDTAQSELAAGPDEATRARHYPVFALAETVGSEPTRATAARHRARPRSAPPVRLAALKSVWRANPGRIIQVN
jgi:hypothetical protein